MTYGITCWGGSPKTHILAVEQAQRLILKISLFKPYRFPTRALHEISHTLTVRQLYILHTALKQHSHTPYSTEIGINRRNFAVCSAVRSRTFFLNRFLVFQGPRLYNIINKDHSIFGLCKFKCKQIITNWLLTLNYEQTENILSIIK